MRNGADEGNANEDDDLNSFGVSHGIPSLTDAFDRFSSSYSQDNPSSSNLGDADGACQQQECLWFPSTTGMLCDATAAPYEEASTENAVHHYEDLQQLLFLSESSSVVVGEDKDALAVSSSLRDRCLSFTADTGFGVSDPNTEGYCEFSDLLRRDEQHSGDQFGGNGEFAALCEGHFGPQSLLSAAEQGIEFGFMSMGHNWNGEDFGSRKRSTRQRRTVQSGRQTIATKKGKRGAKLPKAKPMKKEKTEKEETATVSLKHWDSIWGDRVYGSYKGMNMLEGTFLRFQSPLHAIRVTPLVNRTSIYQSHGFLKCSFLSSKYSAFVKYSSSNMRANTESASNISPFLS